MPEIHKMLEGLDMGLLAQVIHAVDKKVPEIPKNPKMPTCLVHLTCQSESS